MEENRKLEPGESEVIYSLDLGKYGLKHLGGRDILTLSEEDMDTLLEALGNDDIALNVPIPFGIENVQEILSYSECRKCGRCCNPNPLNPESPGIEVFEKELAAIANYLMQPYEGIKEKTSQGKLAFHPIYPDGLESTRWMPQPCPLLNEEKTACTVHSVRPVVCSIHPIIFTDDKSCITIKANCAYGKDMIKRAYRKAKEDNPYLEIPL